jgi:hypothetical protein
METALKWFLWAATFSLWSFLIYFIVLHNTPFHWLLTGSGHYKLVLVSGLLARITIFGFLCVPLMIAYQIGVYNGERGAEPMFGRSRE